MKSFDRQQEEQIELVKENQFFYETVSNRFQTSVRGIVLFS